jgi:GrpB-like predicted nucleotidyltransferase (UPF0157 family)
MDQTPIRLVDPDPDWPAAYEHVRRRLVDALPDGAVRRIAHVGSTAVRGLAAKPTVDVAVEAAAGRAADSLPALLGLGYEVGHRHEDWTYCRLERADGPDVNCHLFDAGSGRFDDGVAFRDALREDPETRERYERLKRRLAERNRHDDVAYARAKSAFVAAVLARRRGERERLPGVDALVDGTAADASRWHVDGR